MPGILRTSSFLNFLTFVAPCHAADRLPTAARADRVIVLKSARTLTLLDHGKVLKEYNLALDGTPVGPKTRQGDHKAPEGNYILDRRNQHSQFYRAIHISYPNPKDRAQAQKLKISPGGDMMIHGLPNRYGWLGKAHLERNWTDGCRAVTNEKWMRSGALWRMVPLLRSDPNAKDKVPWKHGSTPKTAAIEFLPSRSHRGGIRA